MEEILTCQCNISHWFLYNDNDNCRKFGTAILEFKDHDEKAKYMDIVQTFLYDFFIHKVRRVVFLKSDFKYLFDTVCEEHACESDELVDMYCIVDVIIGEVMIVNMVSFMFMFMGISFDVLR